MVIFHSCVAVYQRVNMFKDFKTLFSALNAIKRNMFHVWSSPYNHIYTVYKYKYKYKYIYIYIYILMLIHHSIYFWLKYVKIWVWLKKRVWIVPRVIRTYGSVWITCVLVWIMGYGSHVVPGYGSEPYILSRSHMLTSQCLSIHLSKIYSQPWSNKPCLISGLTPR